MTSFYNLLKYAATGQASPDMTYYDKLRASTLMGGATVQTLTGQPPLTFKADGTPLISWSMKGNGSQQGTPTLDNPVMPEFVGTLDGADWKIPITCAGQNLPVYLGEVPTVRRVKKLVLTGDEIGINKRTSPENSYSVSIDRNSWPASTVGYGMSSHFVRNGTVANLINGEFYVGLTAFSFRIDNCADAAAFKSYLAAQYAAGTPVTVWYVLATPETAIVNEPLAKIGDYADELSSTDAAVTIPTIKGQNTLTVETELQPSEMTITGRIQENV